MGKYVVATTVLLLKITHRQNINASTSEEMFILRCTHASVDDQERCGESKMRRKKKRINSKNTCTRKHKSEVLENVYCVFDYVSLVSRLLSFLQHKTIFHRVFLLHCFSFILFCSFSMWNPILCYLRRFQCVETGLKHRQNYSMLEPLESALCSMDLFRVTHILFEFTI